MPSRLQAIAHRRLKQIEQEQTATLPSPQPKQREFIESKADIAIYGGAAGAGKSLALLLDFAKPELLDTPGYSGVIFRRTYAQVKNEGGLWDEASKWYPMIAGHPLESRLEWRFPGGATIRFAHLQHEKNRLDWQGSQLPRIAFDELTHFSETQFFYLLSRARTTIGIKPQVRATTNPDAESWVAKLVSWWIEPTTGLPIPERSGVVRWFVRINGDLVWGDRPEDLTHEHPGTEPKSFTFIPANITDNPILLSADPGYLANLMAQHPVDRARLLDGNWKVKHESGSIFKRHWFQVVNKAPPTRYYRFWDLAATSRAIATPSAFWTAGVKLCRVRGIIYIIDAVAEQVAAGEVPQLMKRIAQQDGDCTSVRWELEGGSAGRILEESLIKELRGFDARAIAPTGDKVSRALPLANAAFNGTVFVVRGEWNETYLNALQSFDGTKKPLVNDLTDASSGAYACLPSDFEISESFIDGVGNDPHAILDEL